MGQGHNVDPLYSSFGPRTIHLDKYCRNFLTDIYNQPGVNFTKVLLANYGTLLTTLNNVFSNQHLNIQTFANSIAKLFGWS